jgi:hypothetical protein
VTHAWHRSAGVGRWLRITLINITALLAMMIAVEVVARIAIYATRGSATAGLQERTLNLEYEPFVMFGPGWDRRLAEPHVGDVPTVLLVGGSTAQGFAPEILERALARRFDRRVRVVNAAYGGYNVRQEVVVAALWGGRLKPAALVSLDGQNDFEHRLRVAEPGRFFLDSTYRLYLTRPWVAPLAFLASHSQAYNALSRISARRHVGQASEYADAIPVYLEGQHSLTVIARGLGASRLMVLQPFAAFKQPRAAEEQAFTAYAYREPVMRALYDRAAAGLTSLAQEDGAAFLDARPLFNGIDEAIFTDDVHFRTSRGYDEIARAIASALPDDALGSARGAARP